jgi:hypothetical protein
VWLETPAQADQHGAEAGAVIMCRDNDADMRAPVVARFQPLLGIGELVAMIGILDKPLFRAKRDLLARAKAGAVRG